MSDETWDGWEIMPMQVEFSHSGDDQPFMVIRCDRFYLDQKTGHVTLWRFLEGKYKKILRFCDYDYFKIHELISETIH